MRMEHEGEISFFHGSLLKSWSAKCREATEKGTGGVRGQIKSFQSFTPHASCLTVFMLSGTVPLRRDWWPRWLVFLFRMVLPAAFFLHPRQTSFQGSTT